MISRNNNNYNSKNNDVKMNRITYLTQGTDLPAALPQNHLRVLGDFLHSVMFPFLCLCNILTWECRGVFRV